MTISNGWRSLHLPLPGAPRLLLKAAIAPTGYHVQLTDLCRVWAERLTKKDIIRRAWDDNCSVDPSEDDKQFTIFLEKIQSALAGGLDTAIDLSPGAEDELHLTLTAGLPKPFNRLIWNVSLTRQTDDVLADTLIVPLLQQATGLQSNVQQPIRELQEKDRVISKITDRLETSGNDLTTVFPGVSNLRTNKQKTQREQLSKHVKGLADFDEVEWRKRVVDNDCSDLWEKLDGVLQQLPNDDGAGLGSAARKQWWRDVSESQQIASEAEAPTLNGTPVSATADGSTSSHNEESVHDEGFQRQATPDHLRQRVPVQSETAQPGEESARSEAVNQEIPEHRHDGDSTTEDEDDLDAAPNQQRASSLSKSSVPRDPPTAQPKKLGALGGRSSKGSMSPARQPTPEDQVSPPKARAKLGAIGGKAIAADTLRSSSPEVGAPSSAAPRKMGIIGGKWKPLDSIPNASMSPTKTVSPEPSKERSRPPTKEPSPSPRETSQERADRKRDQLKKELEQKAKAPAKKKRKF